MLATAAAAAAAPRSGKAFSAGDDLNTNVRARAALVPPIGHGHDSPIGTYNGLRQLSQTVNTAVRNLDKLVIAAVQVRYPRRQPPPHATAAAACSAASSTNACGRRGTPRAFFLVCFSLGRCLSLGRVAD